jgi:DNA-binding NarL/FixJ family response regulator
MARARREADRRVADRRAHVASVRVSGADDGCLTVVAPDAPLQDLGVAVTEAVRRVEERSPNGAAGDLSPREREVARLVAAGYSNRQIADTLVIGEDTAKKHVSHALAKLGLRNRVELAMVAAQLLTALDRST